MDDMEWIDDLRIRGLLSLGQRQAIVHMLVSELSSVRAQGFAFCDRMRAKYPQLWIAYQAKRRVLGLSSSNPTHK